MLAERLIHIQHTPRQMTVHTLSSLINRFMYRTPETLLSFGWFMGVSAALVIRVFGVSRNKENVR
jgi:uncharacterized membrane protein